MSSEAILFRTAVVERGNECQSRISRKRPGEHLVSKLAKKDRVIIKRKPEVVLRHNGTARDCQKL